MGQARVVGSRSDGCRAATHSTRAAMTRPPCRRALPEAKNARNYTLPMLHGEASRSRGPLAPPKSRVEVDMDRSSIGRLLVMAALAFALFQFGPKLFGGGKSQAAQPLRNESRIVLGATPRAPEQFCELLSPEFRVQLSTQGANIRHYQLLRPKYQIKGQPIDLSTTPDLEFNRQLRFDFHNSAGLPAGKEWNVDGNSADWKLDS